MGLDLLDIVYRLEKNFSIKIDREDFLGSEEDWDNKPTQQTFDEYADRLTVKFLCDLVERKIREKNDKADVFPNVLLAVGHSVRQTLAKTFGIADQKTVREDYRLAQLAKMAASPLPVGFWRRLRKMRKDDPDELKEIKAFLRSREYISAEKTMALSLGITFVWCLWLGIIGQLWKDISSFLVVLFVPGVILFGLRFVFNGTYRRKFSDVTVGEIIKNIADRQRDHSVRADGLPYSREEIEQFVAETLVEALAVDPKEIKPEAKLIKDLGAE